jgi:hypothetical protein
MSKISRLLEGYYDAFYLVVHNDNEKVLMDVSRGSGSWTIGVEDGDFKGDADWKTNYFNKSFSNGMSPKDIELELLKNFTSISDSKVITKLFYSQNDPLSGEVDREAATKYFNSIKVKSKEK